MFGTVQHSQLLLFLIFFICTRAQIYSTRSGSYLSFNPAPPCQDDTYDCYLRLGSASVSIENRNISALFQLLPYFTLSDTQQILLRPSEFKVEAFVRIRDRRLLRNSSSTQGTSRYIPILGNLQVLESAGYDLSCQRRSPAIMCCFRWFITSDNRRESCVDVSSISSDWFFITASYKKDDLVVVRAFSPFRPTVVLRNSAIAGSSLNVVPTLTSSAGSLAFRIGMQIPFLSNGDSVAGFSEYFTGDVDEIRMWNTQDAWQGFELETPNPSTEYSKLLLYVPVRYRVYGSSAVSFLDQNYVVQPVNSNQVTGPQSFNSKPASGTRVQQALSVSSGFLAWNISFGTATTTACDPTQPAYLVPSWTKPCFSNYMDQRADARLAKSIAQGTSLDDPSAVATSTPYWRVNFQQYQPDAAAQIVLVDVNWYDTLTASSASIYLLSTVDLSLESGLPFYQGSMTRDDDPFKALLPSTAAELVQGGNEFVLNVEDGCMACAPDASTCNCLQLRLSLSRVGQSCPSAAVFCPAALAGDPSLRLLCYDWWVPRPRGWSISLRVAEISSLYAGYQYTYGQWSTAGALPDSLQVLMGYEASPEWVSRDEVPFTSAYTCSSVSYLEDVGVAEGTLYLAVPGSLVRVYLRARDRNLGDAVDILPLDDPGLPNGARLCPSPLYSSDDPLSTCDPHTLQPSQDYQTNDCPADPSTLDGRFESMPTFRGPLGFRAQCVRDGDRLFARPQAKQSAPRYWDRTLLFSPSPNQAGSEYILKFVAASYPAPTCVGADWQLGQACMQTVTGAFPGDDGYPSGSELSRTVRSIRIKVPKPVVQFEDTTPLDGSDQVFISGCSFTRIRIDVTGSAQGVAEALNGTNVRTEGRYEFVVTKDPEQPPPDGVVLLPRWAPLSDAAGRTSLSYEVTWAPGLTAPAAVGCFIAADTPYGIARARRCFRFLRDRCRYCLGPTETLQSVGQRFGVDWLQIYLANPLIKTPDAVPPNTLLYVGVRYQVRPGDTPAGIASRFAQPEAQLRELNDEMLVARPGGGGGDYFLAGSLICVIPRACEASLAY